MLRSLILFVLLLIVPRAGHAQLMSWSLDTDLTASGGGGYNASVFGNYTFETEGDRQYLRLPEADGVLILPEAAAQLLDYGFDFEIQLDFRFEAPANQSGFRQIVGLRSAPCGTWIMRCYGTGVSAGDRDGALGFTLNFADGLEGQISSHPANSYFDNLKDGGANGFQTDWNTLRYVVSPLAKTWMLVVNDVTISGTIDELGEDYRYDMDAIMSHVLSNSIVIGGDSAAEAPWDGRAMHVDNVAIYSPRFFDGTHLTAAFDELTAHVTGQVTHNASRLAELYQVVADELPTPIDAIRDQALAFLSAYEANRPPLFESEQRIRRNTLSGDARAAYLIMDRIQSADFVNDRVTDHASIKFEARESFPGVIDPNEPRVASAQVTWDGTYQLNPNIILTASEFVVRPSGYWAPAGELITVEMPQQAVDSGVSILVGSHFRLVTDDLETQNRFHDIGTEFPVDRTTMMVANPFGGGIYLKVPDGTALGDLDVTISGAVKSAFYSHRTGNVTDWVNTVTTTSVPWVDLESDRFMTTLRLDMATRITNPDEIMDRWDLLFSEHSDLAGRTEPNGRAEYYILDRQLVTPAFGAGYPVTIGPEDMRHSTSGDYAHDFQWGTWNPLRVVNYRPNYIFLHELGHNLLLNEFLYPDGISFTSESSVHIWGSKIYHTVYGMSPDETFRASAFQRFSMEQAAMDWMLTDNFRHDMPIGHDPTMNPDVSDQIRYQQRGHAPIVDFAWLFGWDKLGETYGLMYDGTFPSALPEYRFSHVRTRDQLVEASSIVTGVDTSPFWYFWGWQPSEVLRNDLATRFPQSPAIRDRIEYFRSIIPADAAGYEPWHEVFMAQQDGIHGPRWMFYHDNYESSVRDEVLAQFDRILSMPVAVEDEVLPLVSELTSSYPNPFQSRLTLDFSVAVPGPVRLALVDMLGREVAVLVDQPYAAGRHQLVWESTGLAAGSYFVRFRSNGKESVRPVMLVH